MRADTIRQMAALAKVCSACRVDIASDETGWHARVIDPARVSFIRMDVGLDAFTDFIAGESFSVDIDDLAKALKGKGDTPELIVGNGMAVLKGEGMTTKLNLLVEGDPVRALPELELDTQVFITSDPLVKIVKAIEGVTDTVTVDVNDERVSFEGFSRTGAGSSQEIPADGCQALAGEARAMYPLNYFALMTAAMPKGTDLEIALSRNMPLVMRFMVAGVACVWMVAPHVDEED